MTDANKVDRELRRQLKTLRTTPLDGKLIRSRRTQRKWLALLTLVAGTIALTVFISLGVIASRTALDPSFRPPILDRTSIGGKIESPAQGRELVTWGSYLGNTPGAGEMGVAHGAKGYAVAAQLELAGLETQFLIPEWTLRKAGDSGPIEAHRARGLNPFTPTSQNQSLTTHAWLPLPRTGGAYVVDLKIVDEAGDVLGRFSSAPFVSSGADCCQPYVTRTYRSQLPRNWVFLQDYQAEGGRRYTSDLRGPAASTLLIDTTLNASGDATSDQRTLEALLSSGELKYRRIQLSHRESHGDLVVEWSYQYGQSFYTDELFQRGGYGYAIRGRSQEGHVRELRDICREVVSSLETVDQHGRAIAP